MNKNLKVLYSFLLLMILSCNSLNLLYMSEKPFLATFDNQEEFQKNWKNNSWKSPASYQLEKGFLKISTRPNSNDRVKIRSRNTFTTGKYTWRIFVPKFNLYEQVSIGAFLYHNQEKEFEFDFEIGSGQEKDREQLGLKNDEAIVFCVSQFEPFNSSQYPVQMNDWSTFTIELLDIDGFYFVKWYINNQLVKELQTQVDTSTAFRAHCSLENLGFIGDKKTTQENFVLFDYFEFKK